MDRKIGIILGLVILASSCENSDRPSRIRVQTVTAPTTIQPVPTPSPSVSPQTSDVKVQVVVDSAADLRIVAGSSVQAGQAIAERYSVRQKLASQRQILAIKLQEIQQSDRLSLSAPQLEQAKLDLQAAELDLQEFSASRRWTNTAYQQFPDLTEAEAKKGRLLQERYQQAQNRLKIVDNEFKKSIAQDKRQKELIVNEIAAIDRQISKVGIALSPYSGTIKEIKLIGLPGKEITAEITIAVPATKLKRTPVNAV